MRLQTRTRRCWWLAATAAALAATTPAIASEKLAIDHIDMKPSKDGLYDATVGLVMSDSKLGKDKKVTFSIVVADVHDADEAITKVHEPVKTLSEDLQRGYNDLHREP